MRLQGWSSPSCRCSRMAAPADSLSIRCDSRGFFGSDKGAARRLEDEGDEGGVDDNNLEEDEYKEEDDNLRASTPMRAAASR